MFDKHLRRWHEKKVYARKQNASGALLSKKERQNLFINSGTLPLQNHNPCVGIKWKGIYPLFKYFPPSHWMQPIYLTYLMHKIPLLSPNNVLTSFKNLLLQWSAKKKIVVHGYSEEINSFFQCLDFLLFFIPSHPLLCSLLSTCWFRRVFNHPHKIKFGRKKVFPIRYISINEPTWMDIEFNYTIKTPGMQQKLA